jgi:hypothetical protein
VVKESRGQIAGGIRSYLLQTAHNRVELVVLGGVAAVLEEDFFVYTHIQFHRQRHR